MATTQVTAPEVAMIGNAKQERTPCFPMAVSHEDPAHRTSSTRSIVDTRTLWDTANEQGSSSSIDLPSYVSTRALGRLGAAPPLNRPDTTVSTLHVAPSQSNSACRQSASKTECAEPARAPISNKLPSAANSPCARLRSSKSYWKVT